MAKIRIDLTEPLLDGMDIRFKAPCDCTAITGMTVYYPQDDGNMASQTFVFKDAHGNNLTGIGNLFSAGAVVKVLVDRTTSSAYIQNADTNAYLENKIANAGSKVTLSSSVTSTSTTTAANSYAVKQAYDKAVAAAGERVEFALETDNTEFSIQSQKCAYRKIGSTVMVSICLTGKSLSNINSLWFKTVPRLPTPPTSMVYIPAVVAYPNGGYSLLCAIDLYSAYTQLRFEIKETLPVSVGEYFYLVASFVYETTD